MLSLGRMLHLASIQRSQSASQSLSGSQEVLSNSTCTQMGVLGNQGAQQKA
jgi:hypothetical protein